MISIVDFLNTAALSTDQDEEKPEKKNSVKLMTIHAAKGLEFNYVFIVGLEENLFPNQYVETESDVEEERRLLYVAITRAKERCFISYAKNRFRNGQSTYTTESRFLHDIDKKFLAWQEDEARNSTINPYGFSNSGYVKRDFSSKDRYSTGYSFTKQKSDVDIQMKTLMDKLADIKNNKASHSDNTGKLNSAGIYKKIEKSDVIEELDAVLINGVNFSVGDRVIHDKLGRGTITKITKELPEYKAEVDFDEFGKKILLLRIARIKKA